MTAKNYDIITIGGGIAGSTLAKNMADVGMKVVVVEYVLSAVRFVGHSAGRVLLGGDQDHGL